MAQATRTDIYAALAKKSGFEVLQESETPKQLRVMGRSYLEKWPFFLPIVHKLLTTSGMPGNGWTCDISKQYFLSDGRVLYGWRFIFQSADLPAQYPSIVLAINSAPRPQRVELESQPLAGYKPNQIRGGVNEKGKGASSAGSAPLIIARQGRAS
jgi:hypothetical protein